MEVAVRLEEDRGRREEPVCLLCSRRGRCLSRLDPAVEGGAPLEGQLVAGQVLGFEAQSGLQGPPPQVEGLAGNAVDEIDGKIRETGAARSDDRIEPLAAAVAPPEERQDPVIEGLHPDAHPVDAGLAQARECVRVDIPGVDLHGDLGVGADRQGGTDAFQEMRQQAGGQARGGASADVDRVEGRGEVSAERHLGKERLVPLLRAGEVRDRIEVAVGAL